VDKVRIMAESQILWRCSAGRHAGAASQLEIVENRSCTGISDSKRNPTERQGKQMRSI